MATSSRPYLTLLIETLGTDEPYDLLLPIGQSISESVRAAEAIWDEAVGSAYSRSEGNLEGLADIESFIDDERGRIEELLGLAFIACQVSITDITASVRRIRQELNLVPLSREEVLRSCSRIVAGTSASEVQVINAAANYVKHRSEWRGPWSKLSGSARRTSEVLKAVGACQGSTGNLRIIAEVLGSKEYSDTLHFGKIIMTWGNTQRDFYRQKARALGAAPDARTVGK